VIKFVSDLRQIGGFSPVSSINKTDRHDIAEILLKVTLNTGHKPKPISEGLKCWYQLWSFWIQETHVTSSTTSRC